MKKILSVFGTRPEAIKMAPVLHQLEKKENVDSLLCVTGQHRQMLDQVLKVFSLRPDFDLDVMSDGQDLFDTTSRILLGMRDILRKVKPDVVVVHGDTTTCVSAGLAAFYEGISVAHVEAGLRTGNIASPFPEEVNRSLVSKFASFHFAPTELARSNLLAENIRSEDVFVTGNTVVDALHLARKYVLSKPDEEWRSQFFDCFDRISDPSRRLVLITGHRRESFGQPFLDFCLAVKRLANAHPDWDFVYPIHLNPKVREPAIENLSDMSNVFLIRPQPYLPFVWLMNRCDLILTDSGGIQEEAASLSKPVLVTRGETERPEALHSGSVKLVGTSTARIVEAAENILTDKKVYRRMASAQNPFGDGRAAERIASILSGEKAWIQQEEDILDEVVS